MTDPADLTDRDLWQGIAEDGEAITEIARQQAIILGGHAGAVSAEIRAQLADSLGDRWQSLYREIEAFRAELRRRGYTA